MADAGYSGLTSVVEGGTGDEEDGETAAAKQSGSESGVT